uniref:Uncharacterized protein n=1 Tax=viral metagenome TaxID=1070528 RepID=A0A6C0JE98_9ZZZZ
MRRITVFLTILIAANSTRLTQKKLCVNCKHFIQDKRKCAIFGETDLITGKIDYEYASYCRKHEGNCGDKAIYYEENKHKHFTIPYYFYKEWWPVIYLGMIYSILLFYLNKIANI